MTPLFTQGEHDQDTLHGALSIGSYVVFWLVSSVSPLAVLGALVCGWWRSAALLVALLFICSLPAEPNSSIRAWISRGHRVYWKEASLSFEDQIEPDAPTLLSVHPHGVFCLGWAGLFTREELRDVHWCFAPILYNSPIFRAFTSLIGRPASASKAAFTQLMRQRKSIALLPGGVEEAAISSARADRVFLRDRKGWIKYALQHGYSITPVFTFGERETYATADSLVPLRLWLCTFGLAGTLLSMLLVFPVGRWWCPILPRNRRLHTVVGTALKPPADFLETSSAHTGRLVTEKDVNDFHERYVHALVALYDRHKVSFYGKLSADTSLEIW